MGGAQPMMETMIRLAGGPKALTKEVDLELYIQQAQEYEKMQESKWDKVLQGLATASLDHPFPAVRAREIKSWCDGEQFQRLLRVAGGRPANGKVCPSCHQALEPQWRFCKHCGAPNPNT